MKFLEQIAEEYLTTNKYKKQVVYVFPNRRSILFFNNYITSKATKTVWLPKVYAIDQFFNQLSPIPKAENFELSVWLYQEYEKLYQAQIKENGDETQVYELEPFDSFFHWGQIILKDFEDINKGLADPKKVLHSVKDEKEIEALFADFLSETQIEELSQFWKAVWESKKDSNSEHKKKFLLFWKLLPQLKESLENRLFAEGFATTGMQYKSILQDFGRSKAIFQFEELHFVGLAALSKAEREILKLWAKEANVFFHWDFAQELYPEDSSIAGLWPKRLKAAKLPNLESISSRFSEDRSLEVYHVRVNRNIEQVMYLSQLFESQELKLSKETGSLETGIILPNPDILIPLLNALPERLEEVNVTMGYGIKFTSTYSFTHTLFQLLLDHREDTKFYPHKLVLGLLEHQFIAKRKIEKVIALIKDTKKEQRSQIPAVDLVALPEVGFLFEFPTNQESVLKYLESVFSWVLRGSASLEDNEELVENSKANAIEKEAALMVFTEFRKIKSTLTKAGLEISASTLKSLIFQYFESLSIPFQGEPLKGLQVMELLESRNLDFDNLIVLNFNEGLIPGVGNQISFIPHRIRKVFELPLIEEAIALQAYYFTRLLFRSKRVFLISNQVSDGFLKAEASRFLYLMEYQLGLKINTIIPNSKPNLLKQTSISVEKSPEIYQKLVNLLDPKTEGSKSQGITPSALQTFLRCELQFALKYLLKARELEDVSGAIERNVIGTILHNVMDNLYVKHQEHFKRKQVNKSDFDYLNSISEETLIDEFNKQTSTKLGIEAQSTTGRNLLILNILREIINRLLELDKASAPFEILGLEISNKQYQLPIEVETADGKVTVTVSGVIDRIDRKIDTNTIRVIDYKTGAEKTVFKSIEAMFDPKSFKDWPKGAQQLLIYSLMVRRSYPEGTSIQPHLLIVKEAMKKDFQVDVDSLLVFSPERNSKEPVKSIFNGLEDELIHNLRVTFERMLNKEVPFAQTTNEDFCKFCTYARLCNRLTSN